MPEFFRENIEWWQVLWKAAAAWIIITIVQVTIPRIAAQLRTRFRLYLLPLVPIIRLLVLVVVGVSIFNEVVDTNPQNIFAILGAAGIALGFAFKDYVSSIIAGIVAIYERPYQPGDWVEIGGDYGLIKAMGMRAIKIVTPDDTTVTIPHSRIWGDNIANANAGNRDHMVVADFYLLPGHDADAVRNKLWDVGMTSPYLQLYQPVFVIVQEKPWGTHYRLKAYPIDGRDEFQFLSDLTVRGKEALAEMDVTPAVLPVLPFADGMSRLQGHEPSRHALPS